MDRLPWDPPDYHEDWDRLGPPGRRLRLDYVLGGTAPPGVPGWFIARAHRFATTGHRPWRTGVLLAHPDGRHLGLLRLAEETNTVHLEVRGPHPAGFLAILDLYFSHAIARRYPGLQLVRTVPCPCAPDCTESFPYDQLVNLADRLRRSFVDCRVHGTTLPIAELIDGINPARLPGDDACAVADTIRRIEASVDRLALSVRRQGEQAQVQAERQHLDFARLMGWLQVATPTVFTLTESTHWLPGTQRYTLRLYCAEPDAMHPLPGDRGCYTFDSLEPWAGAVLRHLTRVAGLLAHVSGLTGSVLGQLPGELLRRTGEDLKSMGEVLDRLREGGETAETRFTERETLPGAGPAPRLRAVGDADARAIEQLLQRLDPGRRWGGLSKTSTPSGLTLYLCADHEAAYRAPSPRPRGI